MIRQATAEDRAALLDIWCAAFGDSPDYAAFVIDHCLELGTVLFHPRGMSCMTLFPLTLFSGNKKLLEGFYVYGVVTHPQQQKMGFASLLLDRARTLAPFLLLYPATQPLQEYYKKRGFDTPVRLPAPLIRTATGKEHSGAPVRALYQEYKKDAEKQEFIFVWPFSMFHYAYQECRFRSGYVLPPHFCYPSEKENNVVMCKPYAGGGNNDKALFLQALAHFHDPVPGFITEKSLFYLPLD
ncbi:MAG TPA: GNAT family N-acetyltransferase [Bacteroidales bacterium]|jgi:GNAT superfamily N-acetyltransferase|nr:GNAT family N-acetyltransferase [Bacteroidales bacterium]MCZ2418042.1 GNAT family N-acetyltransferase [Burkholderiales bacterium]OQC57714.1 MAG: hypothetical protein BWX52_00738 [Bacteroidetes bacterium ADurb.Bin013]MBP9000273.1 GNAT family N-acetyltransferase [Bacteroidales bacterium]MBV6456787.1 hypothetical protein [Bacteroidales bacterium]